MEYIEILLRKMLENDASDLHLNTGEKPTYRIDGDLERDQEYEVIDEIQMNDFIGYFLSDEEREMLIEEGEIDLAYDIKDVSRYRVNIFKEMGKYSMAIRKVPVIVKTFEELHLPKVLERLARKQKGMILVTGPTGSGKSTTMSAIIDYINKNMSRNIVTLEHPIEMVHKNKRSLIHQREVGRDTMSFESGLKAVLRQDPDIIMVAELRDKETITAAITAAETGHLVIGTLHTRTASSTVNRIIDVFPEAQQDQIREQLSQSLVSVVSQRLVKKIGGGRIAVTEIMINNSAIANLIKTKKTSQIDMIIETSNGSGMMNMKRSANTLVEKGLVDELMVNEIFLD